MLWPTDALANMYFAARAMQHEVITPDGTQVNHTLLKDG